MRADRLLSILMLLQTKGQMTAQELADKLEVSPRTIYRDLEALSISGVPVYAERGPNGGCMLMESYRTNLTGLKEQEVRALFMFTVPGLMADLGINKESESALLKLTAALPVPFQQDVAEMRQRLHLDPTGWFQPEEPVPHLTILQEGIWQEKRVRIVYRRGDGQWVTRLLEPYGLVAKASVWYVVGVMQGRLNVYRVSRIQESELTDGRFTRLADFNLPTYWKEWCEQFENIKTRCAVRIRVAPAGMVTVVQTLGEGVYHLATQTGQIDSNGRTILDLTFESPDAACRQLIGLGTLIEVLEPDEVRQKIFATAVQIATYYATTPYQESLSEPTTESLPNGP